MLVALPFGVISEMRRGHADGTALNVTAQTLAAVPVVWAGMMLVVVFAVWLGWLPAQGFPRSGWSDPGLAFRSLLLPAITIGVIEGAMLMRFVRSATLNTYNTGMFAALLAFHAANAKLREHQRLLIASRESERDAHMLALRFQLPEFTIHHWGFAKW